LRRRLRRHKTFLRADDIRQGIQQVAIPTHHQGACVDGSYQFVWKTGDVSRGLFGVASMVFVVILLVDDGWFGNSLPRCCRLIVEAERPSLNRPGRKGEQWTKGAMPPPACTWAGDPARTRPALLPRFGLMLVADCVPVGTLASARCKEPPNRPGSAISSKRCSLGGIDRTRN